MKEENGTKINILRKTQKQLKLSGYIFFMLYGGININIFYIQSFMKTYYC